MENKVVVTGFGLTSSVAVGEKALKAAIQRKEWTVVNTKEDLDWLADEEFTPAVCRRMDSFTKYGVTAAKQAYDHAGLEREKLLTAKAGGIFSTVWGPLVTTHEYFEAVVENGPSHASPFLFPYTVTNAALGAIARLLGLTGVSSMLVGCCPINYACDLIMNGKADLIVAGGIDNGATFFSAQNLTDPDRVYFEGAAAVVLENEEHARKRGAAILGEILAFSTGNIQTTEEEELRKGIKAVLALVNNRAALSKINGVISMLDGFTVSAKLERVEETVIREVTGEKAELIRPYQGLTDLFGPHSTLNLISALMWLKDTRSEKPDANRFTLLSNSYGFGGNFNTLLVAEARK